MSFQSDQISVNKEFSSTYKLDVSGNINIDGSLYFNDVQFIPNSGTVTSVDVSVPIGLSVSGTHPITTLGTLNIEYQSGYSISTDASKANWNDAHTHSLLEFGNPHKVTKSDVSLGNVLNVRQVADASVGVAFGVATLDGGGKVPATQLPYNLMEYKGNWNPLTNDPLLSNSDPSSYQGNVYICTQSASRDLGSGVIDFSTGDWVIFNGDIWEKSINSNAVVSVNNKTGIVTLTTSDVSEGTNEYYTEQKVSANTDVSANTAKRHSILTLNASNGLYLTAGAGNQELNLNTASSTTTGALTSSDWNTFNNKNDVSFGSGTQIPFMNNSSTNFSYSNNLTWDGSVLELSDGTFNVLIGKNTGKKLNLGNGQNTIIGYDAAPKLVSGQENTFVGTWVAYNVSTGEANTFIGSSAGGNTNGSLNVLFGLSTGSYMKSGNGNTMLGTYAGQGMLTTDVSGSVFIGYQAGENITESNRLVIDNRSRSLNSSDPNKSKTQSLVYGEFDASAVLQLTRLNSQFELPWITEASTNQILYIDSSGKVTKGDLPTSGGSIDASDGALLYSNAGTLGGTSLLYDDSLDVFNFTAKTGTKFLEINTGLTYESEFTFFEFEYDEGIYSKLYSFSSMLNWDFYTIPGGGGITFSFDSVPAIKIADINEIYSFYLHDSRLQLSDNDHIGNFDGAIRYIKDSSVVEIYSNNAWRTIASW